MTAKGEEVKVGVHHSGLVVYRDMLRIRNFPWARIVQISYRSRNFELLVRPEPAYGAYLRGKFSRSSSKGPLLNESIGSGGMIGSLKRNSKRRSTSSEDHAVVSDKQGDNLLVELFRCSDDRLTKRLYDTVVESHIFYRQVSSFTKP
ncbi:unnamed protein product [Protopolystoma xenopodis]|uniref:FERM C-terminal PH-like domain-containing protein n=1 Tax=Protopolystoma xenopodis TaxID=117903 RepID=A0A448X9F9_9PLAT|nr:unnamed protein product [Protopolystoma xenopodis]